MLAARALAPSRLRAIKLTRARFVRELNPYLEEQHAPTWVKVAWRV